MKIDNSAFSMYNKCGLLYYERYEAPNDQLVQITGTAGITKASRGIELNRESESLQFGTRLHQLLHERRLLRLGLRAIGPLGLRGADLPEGPGGLSEAPEGNNQGLGEPGLEVQLHAPTRANSPSGIPDGFFRPGPELANEGLEAEAQALYAAYDAHWVKDFVYLESERTHCIPLDRACPQCGGDGLRSSNIANDQRACARCAGLYTIHELVTKLDAVVRYPDGTIGPFDTKTESRPGYNTREDWAGRTQAKIYLWALGTLYPQERVSGLTVDVVSRASAKNRRGPIFSRIQDISGTPEALSEAIRNVNYVADRIEYNLRVGWFPSNMNACKKGWEKCDFYDLHVGGRSESNLRKYRPAEQYLDT